MEALARAERHRAMAPTASDLAGVSIALNITALVRLNTGHPQQARELLQGALDTATRAGNRATCSTRPTTWAWCTCATATTGPACELPRRV